MLTDYPLTCSHPFLCSALGWNIHPSIVKKLPSAPKIADIATGAASFLAAVAPHYPDAQLDGFDISSSLFQQDAIPPNINFHLQDAKQPFPAEFHATYDLVHIRYITMGLDPQDWEVVLGNGLQLLKPGGAIQWVEFSGGGSTILRGEPHSRIEKMIRLRDQFRSDAVVARMEHGWKTLPHLMQNAGLSVETDVVSTDRLPEYRKAVTENSFSLLIASARMAADKQLPGAMSHQSVSELEAQVAAEIESGAYMRYDLHTALGFKRWA